MIASGPQAPRTARVSPERLRQFVADVYRKAGVPAHDADFVADTLVQSDLWGHQSHGVLRVAWYQARLQSGAMKPEAPMETVLDGGAVLVLEANDGIGQVVAKHATEEAVRRARLHGVGVVSVRNSNHFGTCMYFTGMGARQGCITLLTTNGGPNMAPWGGMKKMIGTNPWSVSAPAGRFPPMVMDVANSGANL